MEREGIFMLSIFLLAQKILRKVSALYYVGATDILPEPLSKAEEEYFLEQAKDGDVFARDKLIEHNLRLVVFLAKKYENTRVDLEDLVSIGTIGLIKGINTYKSDKNIKLATYASRCIDNEILMYLRKNKKIRTEVSFDESLSFDPDGNELHLEDARNFETTRAGQRNYRTSLWSWRRRRENPKRSSRNFRHQSILHF